MPDTSAGRVFRVNKTCLRAIALVVVARIFIWPHEVVTDPFVLRAFQSFLQNPMPQIASSRRRLLGSGAAALGLLHQPVADLRDSRPAQMESALAQASKLIYDPSLSRIFETATKLFHNPSHRLEKGSASLLNTFPDNLIICMGEEHNHPRHHAAEFSMLKALRDNTPQHLPVSLGLEMFDGTQDHAAALDDFVFGSDSLSDLKRRTDWDETWGWRISHWAKLLSFAKANRMRVVGLNAPAKVSDFVERHGISGLLGRPRFPEVDLSDKAHWRRFLASRPGLAAARATTISELARAYEAQTLREEWMAQSIAAHAREAGGRILTIMGRNHVVERHGVPNRIQRRLGDWPAPFTVLLQGAEWDPKDGSLPKCGKFPDESHADWLWYMEHLKGCPTN